MAGTISCLSTRPPLSQPACGTGLYLPGSTNHHSNKGLISGRICPPGCVAKWGCLLHGARLAVLQGTPVYPPSSSLCHQPHLAHCLLASFLAPLCALSFSSPQCPGAPGLVLEGPKSCWPHKSRGQSWDFWGSNCLFSCMWGLSGVRTPLAQEGDAYRMVSACITSFFFWRVKRWRFHELYQSTKMCSSF